ncbi:MAG: sialate O-acetylesterase [Planctomycetes bacterium]|nr:sialate O-acetylesterase [Planctomycetota bacterium]
MNAHRFPSFLAHKLDLVVALLCALTIASPAPAQADDDKTLRVFIFAGQSNMEGADSNPKHIERFPPFAGLDREQKDVMFSYCLGRENKVQSDGWESLRPVRNMVGPELSFAHEIKRHTTAPIAIIKVAAGGTHLAGDWNPDQPRGFKLYPLALKWVREALADLDRKKIEYRIEGFVWHQGENDMFEEGAMPAYGANLKNFIARWRADLRLPQLRFYIGELCTKTIWGMDLRPRMYQISLGQREVTNADPLSDFVPTSHNGVEIGNPVGLHYHYGTLGQLQHGVNHAHAYLQNIDKLPKIERPLNKWPYTKGSKIQLFVLAGHRNMEGERAFLQEARPTSLIKDRPKIAFRYNLGGGYHVSKNWEPLGPTGYYDTFGPELSFGARIGKKIKSGFAIAKFTHSGSQIIDWTPTGSEAESRNLYPAFLDFIRNSISDLETKGHQVELSGIFYHVGENDMSMHSYRKEAPDRIASFVQQIRIDLDKPELRWFISQQPPTDHERVNSIDVVTMIEKMAEYDSHMTLIQALDLSGRDQRIVVTTEGIIELGEMMANAYLESN